MKKILSILMMFIPMAMMAQSGTNSPYSQYGLGILNDQATGFNRGMNGLAIGLQDGKSVNYLNPASYSRMDSLTFLLDVGASLQLTNFAENGKKINANNANFEYAVMAFRVAKNLGMSVGILPFSNIGYNYYSTQRISATNQTTHTETYSGSGGIRQLYLGAGYMPVKGLSIGVNFSYLWGDYTRSVVNSYSDENVKTITRLYVAEPSSYRFDAGLQYSVNVTRKDRVTVGATYTYGHRLGGSVSVLDISSGVGSIIDTTLVERDNSLFIPTMYGAGLTWTHASKLTIGADYSLQKWGSMSFPDLRYVNEKPQLELVDDALMDRHKVTVGAEYINNPQSRNYLDRVQFRAGVSYSTPYIKINGADGPKEMSASIGIGLPIVNGWNNRSVVNVSGQWVRTSAPGLITENTFRINVGITFNERWFAKWKLE